MSARVIDHPMKVVLAAGLGVDLTKPERDINDAADGTLRQDAIQNLTERLHSGGAVGGLDLRDLIDSDQRGPRSDFAITEVTNLLLAESGERAALADQYVQGVIERYLITKGDAIEEEAAAIERGRGDDS